jgi:lipopolysaccharide heptosyltransferase II
MSDTRRILLSRMKFIGDVVLTTPVIRAVRETYPDAFIAYLGDGQAVSLLERNPNLNEVIPYDFSRPDIYEQPRMMLELRKRKFDVVVDFFSNPRTAMLMFASNAPVRIGKDVKGRGGLYTDRIQDDGGAKTAIQFHYQYVKPLSVEATHFRTEIVVGEDERKDARMFLTLRGIDPKKPVVGIHPGATWPAKMWPWERFADLARALASDLRCQVIVTQGPKDRFLIEQFSARAGSCATILPVLPLRQLAAILSLAETYVANDNGTMHIAVAVGTPTIGIFGPGEEEIWFPYGSPHYSSTDGHVALRKNVPCHPCHLDHCRSGDEFMECMKLLTVAEIVEAVESRLELRPRK